MLQAISAPARRTFVPKLLPPAQLRAGIALNTLTGRVVMLAGPAVAGVIAGAWGLKTCYAIDAVSFSAAVYATAKLPVMRPDGTASGRGVHAIAEGLRYIRRTPVIAASFLTDLDAMLLGLPVALFPALNAQHFGGRPQTLGLLTAAVGVGGVCTAALAGPASRVSRLGVGMLGGTMIWGAAIAAFALVRSLPLALFCLAVAGAADTLTVTFRSSMVQALTPDELRGRVSSVEYIIGVGGGPLGNVEAGSLATLASPAISAFAGGIGCVAAAALIAAAFPAFTRHRARLPAARPAPSRPVPSRPASTRALRHRRLTRKIRAMRKFRCRFRTQNFRVAQNFRLVGRPVRTPPGGAHRARRAPRTCRWRQRAGTTPTRWRQRHTGCGAAGAIGTSAAHGAAATRCAVSCWRRCCR